MKVVIFGICLLMAVGCFAQGDQPPPDLPNGAAAVSPVKPEPTEPPYVDPCENMECDEGQHCEDDDMDGKGECVCNMDCNPVPDRTRYMACSNQGESYPSLCALERERCLCTKGHQNCKQSNRKNAELAYYGPCNANRDPCSDEDMNSFQRRMYRWYPLALYDRARVQSLNVAEVNLARRVASMGDPDSQYALSSQWLFCSFDKDNDGRVSRTESLFLTAQLHPLESCGPKFITGCDGDNNNILTLAEWQNCLGLDDDEKVDDLCTDLASQSTINQK